MTDLPISLAQTTWGEDRKIVRSTHTFEELEEKLEFAESVGRQLSEILSNYRNYYIQLIINESKE